MGFTKLNIIFPGHDRMADEFAEHLLVSSLAQMCKQQGWHQASRSGLSLFSELARHYIRNIGIISLRYSLHGWFVICILCTIWMNYFLFRHIYNINILFSGIFLKGKRVEAYIYIYIQYKYGGGQPHLCPFRQLPPKNNSIARMGIGKNGQNKNISRLDYFPLWIICYS